MPLIPNVHIVGDESDEAVEGNSRNRANIETNHSRGSLEESETSESTEGDETDENEKETDTSSDEGVDWSTEVTYIARTPNRYSSVDNQESEEMDVETHTETDVNQGDSDVDTVDQNRQQYQKRTLDSDSYISPTKSKSEVPINKRVSKNSDTEETLQEQQNYSKALLATDLQISSSNSESDVTIEEKDEADIKKITSPPLQASNTSQCKLLQMSRLRLASTVADYSSPQTIGGRVAKRARRSVVPTPTQNVDIKQLVAKPLEVTMYFQELSAKLVKSRVKLMPFLGLRHRIDSLVEQAMSQTQ